MKDDVESLPPKLRAYFPIFIAKRISDLAILTLQVEKGDYSGMALFNHKQSGIAASYHLFQYENLNKQLTERYKRSDNEGIKALLEQMRVYLLETSSKHP